MPGPPNLLAERPPALSNRIERLVPGHDHILSPAECERLAVEITAEGLWRGVELTPTPAQTRAYALLHEDERLEAWLLSWLPHHSTGYHDHGVSNVGFCVAQGQIVERQLRLAEAPRELQLNVGDARAAASNYIHCLEWQTGSPALSVHVYSPPLAVVGQYRCDAAGVLSRETQPGRDELTLD